jgi:hypothetical protein
MRQKLNARPITALAVATLLALPAWRALAVEGESVTLNVQGVLATRDEKKATVTPTVAPSLKAYTDVLKRFPYDKYEDIGASSGVVKTGQDTSIKVGSHTIDASLIEIEKGAAKIKYTVKDSGGHSIGSNVMALTPGQVVPVQVGEPAFPIILLFQTGR